MRGARLPIALLIALFAVVSYFMSREENPFTGETQAIALSREQEIALGLQSAPEMAQQFGGVDPDTAAQQRVRGIGARLVRSGPAAASGYHFQFTLLGDDRTVNAFALPGGPVFITRALFDRLQSEAQLAGVLGHEIGHVLGRHAAEQLATSRLLQGLVGAVGVATSDEYGRSREAMLAQVAAQIAQLKYGRDDELQSDTLGVGLMADAGYDPHALIAVMDILEEASGGSGGPEFMSTHPDPGNRRETIGRAIEARAAAGAPSR